VIGEGKAALLKAPGEPGEPCSLSRSPLHEYDQRRRIFRSDPSGATGGSDRIACDTPLRSIRR